MHKIEFSHGAYHPGLVTPTAASCDQKRVEQLQFSRHLSFFTGIEWREINQYITLQNTRGGYDKKKKYIKIAEN